jgi:hypothetical protein
VQLGMELAVVAQQAAARERGREVRCEGRHGELDVGARLVQEMSKRGAGDDVGAGGAAGAQGGADDLEAAVAVELLCAGD